MSSTREFLTYLEQVYIKVLEYENRLYGPPAPEMEIVTTEQVKDVLCPETDHIILCGRKFPVRATDLLEASDGGLSDVFIVERW